MTGEDPLEVGKVHVTLPVQVTIRVHATLPRGSAVTVESVEKRAQGRQGGFFAQRQIARPGLVTSEYQSGWYVRCTALFR